MKKITLTLMAIALSVSTAFAGTVNLKVCASCHSHDWSKSALGKSKIVSELSQQEIADALVGYKNGTYGSVMKAIMKGQVAKYTNEDLIAAAAEIKGN